MEGVDFKLTDEIASSHPANQGINEELGKGKIPAEFVSFKEKIKKRILEAIEDLDVLIVHNILTMHFNLAATSALKEIFEEYKNRLYLLWCHDATYIDPHYSAVGDKTRYPWRQLCEKIEGIRYITITNSRRELLSDLLGLEMEEIKVVYDAIDITKL